MFLGLELTWAADRHWVKITLTAKIDELAIELRLVGMKPVSTAMDPNFDTSLLPVDCDKCDRPYLTILGKVHFIKHWRPDIQPAHTLLSHFSSRYGEYQWLALVRVCLYLHCTRLHGMFMQYDPDWVPAETVVETLADASLGNNKANMHSLIGHFSLVQKNVISVKTTTTRAAVCDIAYAELIAMFYGTKAKLFISNLFVSMPPIFIVKPMPMYGDNLAAHWIARTKSNSSKTKHYDLKYHFVGEKIRDKLMKTAHINGKDNLADFLTKILAVADFLRFRDYFVAEAIEGLKIFVPPTFDKSDLSRPRDA